MVTKWTLNDIKQANQKAGYFWFGPTAMRFFNSHLPTNKVYHGSKGVYFVTSEQFDSTHPRLFSVRVFDPKTCDIDTVGEFQAYASLADALSAAQSLSEGVSPDATPLAPDGAPTLEKVTTALSRAADESPTKKQLFGTHDNA